MWCFRLERALTTASEKLKEALTTQRALQETIERVWRRVDLIESGRQGAQQNDRASRVGRWNKPESRCWTRDLTRPGLDRLEAGDGH